MSLPRAARAALVSLAALAALAPRARAAMEEYSSFDVALREEDDESLFDHVLTRHPADWRDEWEHTPQAFRSAQGCLTSGQWFLLNELKVSSPLGRRARFDLGLQQSHSDAIDYDVLSFGFRFPLRWGTAAAEFQPTWDKSKQDLVLLWEAGADTSRVHVQAAFNVEDLFNNLWAWRQTRVGRLSEPYLHHPYEPRLLLGARGEDWRAEVGGRWMRPSVKRVLSFDEPSQYRQQSLWGTIGWASLEKRLLGVSWEAVTRNQQVRSTDAPVDAMLLDRLDFRREWSAEVTARRPLSAWLDGMTRWIYQDRTQIYGADLGPGAFRGIDRLVQAELTIRARPNLSWQLGAMVDRIRIATRGHLPDFQTYGSRKESRAYVGLAARFGRVRLQGVEGIELDHEPYPVWFIHDKGFLHLQTTF